MESATPATAAIAEAPAPIAAAAKIEMVPIATDQRIEALDVVRGFALIGIFLMNIEFFNRVFASFNEGMPRDLTGLNWFASWFIAYFEQGKFWTIFSLLFGMGFAVMMVRAERAGREFKQVYLRRVLALAVFGALHYIFLWQGDILFSYAVAALMLMIVLYGKTKPLLITIAVVVGLAFIPGMNDLFAVATGLAAAGLFALYMRSEKRVTIRGNAIPIFSFLLLLIGVLLMIAATVFWVLPDGPIEPRWPLTVFGPLIFTTGWLSWKYFEPVEKRGVRLGVGLYVFFALVMTFAGVVQRFAPDPFAGVATSVQKPADDKKADAAKIAPPVVASAAAPTAAATAAAPTVAPAAVVPAAVAPTAEKKLAEPAAVTGDKPAAKSDKKADEKKPKKTKEERAAERKAEKEKNLAENKAEKEKEIRLFSKGGYWETVNYSGGKFIEKAAGDFGFAMVLIGMFLLGVWFVRSGVMENPGAHLPFFKKLMVYGLPIGIGLGLLGSMITMSHIPGDRTDGWGIARGLRDLGNLPACLGYVGMVVLMLHSKTVFANIRVLGPLGRMALTNYLSQSLICGIYFYGYALGHWGMPRGQQVIFVLVIFSAQVAFSHWWLSKFPYGPMEWFWRGFTYRQIPKFKI